LIAQKNVRSRQAECKDCKNERMKVFARVEVEHGLK
jgi:hypothetical protein